MIREGAGVYEYAVDNCFKICINICDGADLELAYSKKGSLYFENNFLTFLSSCNSDMWIVFKVCKILH